MAQKTQKTLFGLSNASGQDIPIQLVWITVIFVVALITRTLWVVYAPVDPNKISFFADMHFYHWAGTTLSAGKGYTWPWTTEATTYWPPGYPFLLGGLYRVFGNGPAIAWGANIALGALTCAVLYVVGSLMISQRVGATAGLLLAIFPGHVFFTSPVLSEVLFTFLIVIAMALILSVGRQGNRGSPLPLIAAGIVVGAASLVRGQGLFLIIVAGLCWWLRTADWEKSLQRTAALLAVALVVIIPWTIRNYVQAGSFVLISTNDGGNLWIGNHEGATGRLEFGATLPPVKGSEDMSISKREVATSNLALQEGLRFMFTHPQEELRLAGAKLQAMYENDEAAFEWIDDTRDNMPLRGVRVLADVANGFYFAVLAVSIGGLLYWLRRPRSAVALPLLVIAVFTLGQLIFFGDSRFHFPMLPSFALLAAVGLSALIDLMTSSRRRRSAARAASSEQQDCASTTGHS